MQPLKQVQWAKNNQIRVLFALCKHAHAAHKNDQLLPQQKARKKQKMASTNARRYLRMAI